MLQVPTTIKLNGEEFKLYPIRDEDNETLHEWVRGQYLNTVLKATQNEEAIALACDRIQDMYWTRPPGNRFMAKRKGIAELFAICCRDESAREATIRATDDEINVAFVGFRRVNDITLKATEDAEITETVNPQSAGQLSTGE